MGLLKGIGDKMLDASKAAIKEKLGIEQEQAGAPTPPPFKKKQKLCDVKSFLDEHHAGVYSIRKIDPDFFVPEKEIMERISMTCVRVYKYKFGSYSVKLVPEPTNAHDPNAIMVLFDSAYVGYIPAELTGAMRRYIGKEGSLRGVISGGPVKEVYRGYVKDYLNDTKIYIETK